MEAEGKTTAPRSHAFPKSGRLGNAGAGTPERRAVIRVRSRSASAVLHERECRPETGFPPSRHANRLQDRLQPDSGTMATWRTRLTIRPHGGRVRALLGAGPRPRGRRAGRSRGAAAARWRPDPGRRAPGRVSWRCAPAPALPPATVVGVDPSSGHAGGRRSRGGAAIGRHRDSSAFRAGDRVRRRAAVPRRARSTPRCRRSSSSSSPTGRGPCARRVACCARVVCSPTSRGSTTSGGSGPTRSSTTSSTRPGSSRRKTTAGRVTCRPSSARRTRCGAPDSSDVEAHAGRIDHRFTVEGYIEFVTEFDEETLFAELEPGCPRTARPSTPGTACRASRPRR